MNYDSQKIEKHFKTSLNSIINKNITIENLEELYIKEKVPSNKGLYSILLEAIKFFSFFSPIFIKIISLCIC